MSKITSAIAAALIASASFASAALADTGDYYDGTVRPSAGHQTQQFRANNNGVSYDYTGSIGNASSDRGNGAEIKALPGNGNYYEGATRPN